MNSRSPSKPNLPNVPKPSKLPLQRGYAEPISFLAYRIPLLDHSINQYEIGHFLTASQSPNDLLTDMGMGCDASVLLDDTSTFIGEKTAFPNNNSLRGFDVVDTIKSQLENICPGVVSCADILAVAARDSVVALGGTNWTVQLGRRDSTTASLTAAKSDILISTLNLSGLLTFSNKVFTAKELVALSGSHTIGQARCTVFRTRI
uniref:peroxidase n=1 Tax=Quercus lobata TaxID=97700 RepID=A0A7N2M5V0_QUELO